MSTLQVLGPLEKGLRSAAELGAWQLISPVDAVGRVLVVDGLHEIQDEVRKAQNISQSLGFERSLSSQLNRSAPKSAQSVPSYAVSNGILLPKYRHEDHNRV